MVVTSCQEEEEEDEKASWQRKSDVGALPPKPKHLKPGPAASGLVETKNSRL